MPIIERIKYFFFTVENDWEFGVAKTTIEKFITGSNLPRIKWFSMPRNVFRGDPFGVKIDSVYYIFYEEYNKDKKYGIIRCMLLNSELKIIDDKVIIDDGTHFSFPVIFKYNDEFYLLPENYAKGKLTLYKAIKFPFEWKEEKVLLNLPCIDSIIFYEDNYWWLIYSNANIDNFNSVLNLRKNVDLFGDWDAAKEFTFNKEAYNTRCGGNVFKHNNMLYRVTQNCKDSYGQSLVINKVVNLSDTDFKEEPVKEIILNNFGVSGCHTLNACGDITLIDRKRERLYLKSFKMIKKSIKNKLLL